MKLIAVLTFTAVGAAMGAAVAAQHDHQMMQRGQQAMGFDQTKTTHHFLLQPTGGTIEIVANDAADTSSVASIRKHLDRIRSAFAAGDFAMPMFVHGTEPPGSRVLTERREHLTYRVDRIESGGRLVITTTDADALAALHAFLKFQITEHKTGDPMVPK